MQINSTDCFPGKSLISVYFLLSHFGCVMPQKLKVRWSPAWLSQRFLNNWTTHLEIHSTTHLEIQIEKTLASAPESARSQPSWHHRGLAEPTAQRRHPNAVPLSPAWNTGSLVSFFVRIFPICKDWFGSSSNWLIQLIDSHGIFYMVFAGVPGGSLELMFLFVMISSTNLVWWWNRCAVGPAGPFQIGGKNRWNPKIQKKKKHRQDFQEPKDPTCVLKESHQCLSWGISGVPS